VNALLMAGLSLDIVGMRWSTWARAHGRGLALAGLVALVVVPVADRLRTTGLGPLAVLLGALTVTAAVVGVAAALAPRRVLGPDVLWVLARVGRRRVAAQPPRPPGDGAIVAVIGADGSGKSTLTTNLAEDLARPLGQVASVQRVYLGSGDGPAAWYRRPMKAVRDRLQPPDTRKTVPHDGPRRSHPLHVTLRTAWALALAAEKVGKTRRADRARRRGVVVVCDRYPQTQCPGGNDGPLLVDWLDRRAGVRRALARWEHAAYGRATRVLPDLVLTLDVPVAIAMQRRPGLDSSYLRRRVELVRGLAWPCPTVVLDAAAPADEVRHLAVAAVAEVVGDPLTVVTARDP